MIILHIQKLLKSICKTSKRIKDAFSTQVSKLNYQNVDLRKRAYVFRDTRSLQTVYTWTKRKLPLSNVLHDLTTLKPYEVGSALAITVVNFVPDYATVAEPLTLLTNKEQPFLWSDEQDWAFKKLKRRLVFVLILAHFVPKKQVEIHIDASTVGVGAVLIQKNQDTEHAVSYASKAHNKAQKNYGATELELYAVIFAVEKFQYYLSTDITFEVTTDHSAIRTLLRSKNFSGSFARWILRLSLFNSKLYVAVASRIP